MRAGLFFRALILTGYLAAGARAHSSAMASE